MNVNKIKYMRSIRREAEDVLVVNGEEIEEVDEYTYKNAIAFYRILRVHCVVASLLAENITSGRHIMTVKGSIRC